MLECAANLACAGAEPLGLTNCLNFGNPEKPHIAWQLSESIRGLGDACRALGVPVVGGNVSLYNEGAEGRSTRRRSSASCGGYPTPSAPVARFAREGTRSALSGRSRRPCPRPSSSSCAASRCPRELPDVDVGAARSAQEAVRDAVRADVLSSAHDVAEGGVAVALAECALAGAVGARVTVAPGDDAWARLFGEAPGRGFVVSGPREALESLGAEVIGEVGGDALEVRAGDIALRATLAELREAHGSLAALFP